MGTPATSLQGSVVHFSKEEMHQYLSSGAWHDETAGNLLRRIAQDHPDRIALVGAGRTFTYRQYNDRSEKLATALIMLGLRPGDRAIFQMGTVPETAIALFACFKAGIIPVCTLPQHRSVEIEAMCELTEPRAYFVQADFSDFDLPAFALEIADKFPSLQHILMSRAVARPGTLSMDALIDSDGEQSLAAIGIETRPEDVMVFQVSGGTTGVPKVIPRLHGEYLAYCQAWAEFLQLGPNDVHLWALPIIHNASMIYHLVPAVLGARKLCLMPRFNATEFFETIERERVSVTGSIGPIASAILDFDRVSRYDLSSLRIFTTLSRGETIEAHIGRPTITVFGISEGLLMGSPPNASAKARHRSVGRPVSPYDEVKLLAPDGVTEVPLGTTGELAFKGASSIRGYVGMPELSRASFTEDGFFRTGDLMMAHEIDGTVYYSFEGRLKDNIDRGGEKFGTEDIEELVARHPAVMDVKVVAMPDSIYGEKPCAYVILRPGNACPSVAELANFLILHGLAKFKVPDRIEVIDAFPVTKVGKVDKVALRRMIAEAVARADAIHATPDLAASK